MFSPRSSRALLGRALVAPVTVAVLFCAGGCDGGGDHSGHATAVPDAKPLTDAEQARRKFLSEATPLPPRPVAPVLWTLPKGWSEKPASQLRQGDFLIEAHPELDCYLTILPGSGGGVLANVNRWRRQMGLDPIAEAALEKLPHRQILDVDAVVVQLEGTHKGMRGDQNDAGYALAGVALDAGGTMLFVKMVGPGEAVVDEMPNLLALADSLRPNTSHRGGAGLPPGHGDMIAGMGDGRRPGMMGGAQAGPPKGAPRWKAPEGWKQGPQKSMRLVTFNPESAPDVECYLTLLAGLGGGDEANINRWRGQLGLPDLGAGEFEKLTRVEILGQQAPLLEARGNYAGMGGESGTGFGMLATVCRYGDQSLFVKMLGPADAVMAEKDRFVEFCKSLGQ